MWYAEGGFLLLRRSGILNIQKWHYCVAVIIFLAFVFANGIPVNSDASALSASAGAKSSYSYPKNVFLPDGGLASDVSLKINQKNMLKIGHRGAAGYEPENTIRSFRKAVAFGVDEIELDVRFCKSGELVVIHDDRVDATTDGEGFVREKTLAELKKLNAGKGEKIPTLEEALDSVDKMAKVNIEIKDEGTAKPLAETIRRYIGEKQWTREKFAVISAIPNELRVFKELMPDIHTGIIGNPSPELLQTGREASTNSIDANFATVTEEFVGKVHAQKMKSIVWTVNREEDIARMKAYGVDGIVSDYPDKL
ncbi:MAG: glycerophosphodiester phosphodiesterase family protein [Candidatus Paceibacterota bacterium]